MNKDYMLSVLAGLCMIQLALNIILCMVVKIYV